MNITTLNIGGTLIPRSLVASTSSAASLVDGIKTILNNGGIMAGISMDVSQPPTSPNAANPAWRDSLFLAFFGTYVALSYTMSHLNLTNSLKLDYITRLVSRQLLPARKSSL